MNLHEKIFYMARNANRREIVNVEDTSLIANYARAIGCRRLFHFTDIRNLSSILEKGLAPVNFHEKIGVTSYKNDPERLDGERWSNLSIEHPSYSYLCKLSSKKTAHYCIIEFDLIEVVRSPIVDIRFSTYNAAASKSKYAKSGKAHHFKSLFEGGSRNNSKNRYGKYPVDPGAEVLVGGILAPGYIKKILFKTNSDATYALETLNIKALGDYIVEVDRDLFGRRPVD